VEIHQTLSSLLIIYKRSALEKNCFKDGAGYHKSDEIKEFLASVNDNLTTSGKLLVFYLHPMPRTEPGRRCLVTGKKLEEKVLASLQNFLCYQVAI